MNKISGLVDQVRKSGIYVTPTNYFFYSFFGRGINEEEEKAKISYQYIPEELKTVAWDVRKNYAARMASEPVRNRYIEIRKKMIEELWKAGVPLMAGSDSPQWFTVAGFAIHEELQNLVLCGLTPYAALQTATINPAKYLGREKTSGTISAGKRADLVILDKNPLENIQNTQQINGVFVQGKWLPKNT
jgi:imidazolonepropionase-like amidohydrolase